MKQRTWKVCLLAVLCLLLAGAVAWYCVLLTGGAVAEREEAAAAPEMPPAAQQTAPTELVPCALCSANGTACGKQAYVIGTESELAYVLCQVRTTELMKGGGVPGTDSCYQLNLPEKAIDLTSWSDTSMGSTGGGIAFTGHFNGNGHRIIYTADGSEGKEGLFPQLTDAVVEDLIIQAELTAGKDTEIGALFRHAQNAVIRSVSATVKLNAQTEGARGWGGLGGTLSGGILTGCEVSAAAPAALADFGGMVYENAGAIVNCHAVLSGASSLSGVGGIASNSGGEVSGCIAQLSGSLSADGVLGGIAGTLSGGKIENCRTLVSVPAGTGSGIGGIAGKLAAGAVTGCYVGGDCLTGATNVGGVVGSAELAAGVAAELTDSECNLVSVGTEAARPQFTGGLVGDCDLAGQLVVQRSVSSANIYTQSGGGLVGRIQLRDGMFSMEDSHCYASLVDAVSYSGGAIGQIAPVSGFDGGTLSVARCTASAAVRVSSTMGGGFVALVNYAQKGQAPDFYDCHAYGSVETGSNYAGGFVAAVHTKALNNRFADCSASGGVNLRTGDADAYYNVAGFIASGAGTGVMFTGCTANGSVKGYARVAGFVGYVTGTDYVFGGKAAAQACTAYGSVLATEADGGGFGGRFETVNCSIIGCTSYGDVSGACIELAGFASIMGGGTIADCTAYGDVRGYIQGSSNNFGVAGFLGNTYDVRGANTITNCTAYGNVSADFGVTVAGFVGELGNTNLDTVQNCVSYGNVTGPKYVGGFAGTLVLQSSIIQCAAYGSAISGDSFVGGFAGRQVTSGTTYQYKNNFYASDMAALGTGPAVTDTEIARLSAADVKPNPKNLVSGTFSASGNGTALALSFSGAAGYRIEELAVSVDGGSYYTLLVYRGAALVSLPAAGLSCQNFTYVYSAPYRAGSVRVRVTLTDGANRMTRILS